MSPRRRTSQGVFAFRTCARAASVLLDRAGLVPRHVQRPPHDALVVDDEARAVRALRSPGRRRRTTRRPRPCGQKSDSSRTPSPAWSANARSAYIGSQLTASSVDVGALEVGQRPVERLELAAADPAEGEREEDQQDGPAPQRGQRRRGAVLVAQREVRAPATRPAAGRRPPSRRGALLRLVRAVRASAVAVAVASASDVASSPFSSSSRLSSLPVALRGSSSMKTISRGTL